MSNTSQSFLLYLSEPAPSLFYETPLDCLSFRWKIPDLEYLMGWTSPGSGIDIVAELQTEEVCGFAGIHFPGMQFLEYVAQSHSDPYDSFLIVAYLEQYLHERNQTLGQHYERIRYEARKAAENECHLKYSTDTMLRSDILTRQRILEISAARSKNLPRA
jgi:hypothetical protein